LIPHRRNRGGKQLTAQFRFSTLEAKSWSGYELQAAERRPSFKVL
jgi:hypothetical protein